MGNSLVNATSILLDIGKYIILGWSTDAYKGDLLPPSSLAPLPTFFSDTSILLAVKEAFTKEKLDKLSDEAILKICRQIEFWYKEGGLSSDPKAIKDLAANLIDQSVWYNPLLTNQVTEKDMDPVHDVPIVSLKVPKVRFGKTNLQMPILTCGGMRFQNTWCPDFIPGIRPSRKFVLKSDPQRNIKQCIRSCLGIGINHFETARFYGTSEYQMVEALYQLIQEGEIKREDFILQTKIPAASEKNFNKFWKQSWTNIGDKLGYIDLLSLHGCAEYDDATKDSLKICEELKKEGKIRHIGFSTHATSEKIMNLINTERFEYVNLHEHYFTSYHGDGTTDTVGGQGNLACVKRALELDMGLFQISPSDKGGKLYRPSKDCATLIGKELTPIGFALLYGWKKIGFHTASIGVARPSDLDEVLQAARLMALENAGKYDVDSVLDPAVARLDARREEVLGKEWLEKGLMNLPSPYDKVADGVHIGHILRMHDQLSCFGMYEWCRDRYISLFTAKWDKKKSWEERVKAIPPANPGRCYDADFDLTEALKNHYNPSLALKKIKETHEWLKGDDHMSNDEINKNGWKKGYNLTVWTEMPGEIDSRAINRVILQNVTGGRKGLVGMGPGSTFRAEAKQIRRAL